MKKWSQHSLALDMKSLKAYGWAFNNGTVVFLSSVLSKKVSRDEIDPLPVLFRNINVSILVKQFL